MTEVTDEELRKIEEYGVHEGSEMGDLWLSLVEMHQTARSTSFMNDEIEEVIAVQIKQELENIDEEFVMIEEEEQVTKTRKKVRHKSQV